MEKALSIRLRRGLAGRPQQHKRVAAGLGLRKLHQEVIRVDTPQIRGMVNKISHLLEVQEVSADRLVVRTRRRGVSRQVGAEMQGENAIVVEAGKIDA